MLTKTKIALVAALVLGTATASFAEDSSSLFGINLYPQGGQQEISTGRNVALTGRNIALPNGHAVHSGTQEAGFDHASSPYAGGGF